MEKHADLFPILLFFSSISFSAAISDDAAIMSAIAKGLVGVASDWLSGKDPCSWYGIRCTAGRITSIDLNSNNISGVLPGSLTHLSSLQNLDLGQNKISGSIPSLAGLSALQTLDLESNAFTSVPHDLFSGLTGLQSVRLDNNPLAPWSIPLDLAHSTKLQSFSAANAGIVGAISDLFHDMPALTELNLSYNSLTGVLPSSFAGSNIQSLCLNNQHAPGLSGQIDVVGAMPQLQQVWLQSNHFTGPIPELSNTISLRSFDVRNNKLTGPVPSSLTSSPNLNIAFLSDNMLQGPFPNFSKGVTTDVSKGILKGNKFCNSEPGPCDPLMMTLLSVAAGFGYPLELAKSWNGNNPCSSKLTGDGDITCDTVGKQIVVLDFSGKHYAGTISPEMAKLTTLTKIIVSNNNLTGPIPDSLTKLPYLQILDVTNNNLTGVIPDFPPSVSLKISGNPLLQSYSSLPNRGSDSNSGGAPTTISSGILSSEPSFSHSAKIWGIISTIFILACCLTFLICLQRTKNCTRKFGRVQTLSPRNGRETFKRNMPLNVRIRANNHLYSQGDNKARIIETRNMFFPFQALQKATNDFSEANILGCGEFGVVYKGNHEGTLIAVKRNVSDIIGNKGIEQFQSEIYVLKNVRHRHLVTLLGYCINSNERLLVYEYMPEGTLGQHLFDRDGNKYAALSWKQRLIIAVDVARGIEYLHDLAQECFIHRNLNPSNILLDKDLRAKVSSFGLVKLADCEKSVQTRLAGTFGYLAPEYAITGKVSTKVDVYAFGVILMELITGRRVIEESRPDEESHLVKRFRQFIVNKMFMNYADPSLDLDEEAHISITDIVELAYNCTAREPTQRPDMGHVVNTLVPFVEKWNPSHCEAHCTDDLSTSLAQKLQKWQFGDGTSSWQFDAGTSTINSFRSHEGSQTTKN